MEEAVITLGPADEVRKWGVNSTACQSDFALWCGLVLGELCLREGARCPLEPSPPGWKGQTKTEQRDNDGDGEGARRGRG